jgi:ABC-type lipoprotein export system ATPase subunit
MLSIDGVCKIYRGAQTVEALRDIHLRLEPGDFVAVQGPSGCGKTTLLLIAGGLLEPDAGQVCLAGEHVYGLSPERRARWRAENIGFVFQQFHLVPYLSVRENVLAPSLATASPDAWMRADALLDRFGMIARERHVPSALSTGERQRTALARALLNRPRLLLADEPTGNLDEANAGQVLEHLAGFAAEGGAVLLVTHSPRAASLAKRTVRMERGLILETTTR